MEVAAGPLAGSYDLILCLSDFETDDLLCLRMLASRCADLPFRMIAGEGDQDKSSLAAHVLGKYGFTNAQVARGVLSDRPYPPEVLASYDSAPAVAISDEPASEFIRKALEEAANPLFVILKPPLELLELLSAADPATVTLLGKAACCVYGSFNFRRVLEVHPNDGDARLQNLLGAFRVAVVAERGPAVGSEGILDGSNTNFGAFDGSLTEVMLAWNGIAARNLSAAVAEDSAALVRDFCRLSSFLLDSYWMFIAFRFKLRNCDVVQR